MGLTELLVALALLPSALRGDSGALAQPEKVPSPSNIVIDSYNFNTSVRWDYKSVSLKTLFTVSIQCYWMGEVNIEVDNCVNITQHYCDITHKIDQSCHSFWVKVKAFNGLHESDYATRYYHVLKNARIGPPKFNLYAEKDEIKVEIEVPLTPYGKKQTLRANITDFTYRVFLWENRLPKKRQNFEPAECSATLCTIYIPVPSWESSYCVSVQGFSEELTIKSEESRESCIDLPPKSSLDLKIPIILGIAGCVLLVMIFAGIYTWFSKKNRSIKLPKSLATVVRNMSPVNFDPKPESRHTALITAPDIKPIVSELDPSGEVNTTDFSDSDQEADSLHSQGTSSLHEGIIVEISGGEQSPEENDNYFRSLSGQEEMCNSAPNLDLPKADVQQPTLPDSCRNISGYDRHRWLPSGVEELLKTHSSSDTPEA